MARSLGIFSSHSFDSVEIGKAFLPYRVESCSSFPWDQEQVVTEVVDVMEGNSAGEIVVEEFLDFVLLTAFNHRRHFVLY